MIVADAGSAPSLSLAGYRRLEWARLPVEARCAGRVLYRVMRRNGCPTSEARQSLYWYLHGWRDGQRVERDRRWKLAERVAKLIYEVEP